MSKYFNSDILFYVIVYFIVIFAFIITLYPFMHVVAISFSGSNAVYLNQVYIWPKGFTLDGYKQVLQQSGLWTAYGNTVYYTLVGTTINVICTTIAAYPLSRRHMYGRRFFNFFMAFTMYFSGGLIPSFLLITNLGFYNSRWVMVIPGLISVWNVMVCRAAFSAVPEELIECAQIDGLNDMQIFYRVAVRLITPTLAVLTLWYAVGHWNNFFTPLLYFTRQELMPLQVLLRRVLIQGSQELMNRGAVMIEEREPVSLQLRYVTIVVATLPILMIYPIIQKYFVKGVMLGAIKG